jgi:lysophospholipase L1-like esterase
MAGFFRALCAAMVTITCAVLAPALTGRADAAPGAGGSTAPVRIMLYGDSLTQGFSGDWTWRYRLWQDLTAAGESFDFVGPKDDVVQFTTFAQGSHEYRNANFDTDHAAVAGMTFTYSYAGMPDLAASYQADVVVAMIGVNDLIRQVATPAQLLDRWRAQIARAREMDPGVSIVLAQLGQTWVPGVTEYDAGLVALAAELDTPGARVVATARPDLAVYSDTYDWLHFSVSGERKVAAMVDEALSRIGVGAAGVRTGADVGSAVKWAPTPTATVSGRWVGLTWSAVDYASSENVVVKDITTGVTGTLRFLPGTSTLLPGEPGHSYEIRMAPVKGYLTMGTQSPALVVDVPAA